MENNPVKRWELRSILIYAGDVGAVQGLFKEGWEPFAVNHKKDDVVRVWLRREKLEAEPA